MGDGQRHPDKTGGDAIAIWAAHAMRAAPFFANTARKNGSKSPRKLAIRTKTPDMNSNPSTCRKRVGIEKNAGNSPRKPTKSGRYCLRSKTHKRRERMPRMSKKSKEEWAFFLNDRGRKTYNEICRKCRQDCKQSFRARLVACRRFVSKRT